MSERWDTGVAISHTHADLLKRMVERGTPGNVLEIGTAGGGSALCLMELVPDQEHFIVTVDPWGSKLYDTSGARYGENYQRGAMAALGYWADRTHVNWHHCKMTAHQFLEGHAVDGCWYGGEWRQYLFHTIFLDGEHTIKHVLSELHAVHSQGMLAEHGVIFVDNANHPQDVNEGGPSNTHDHSMEIALTNWADEKSYTCEFTPCVDGDLLAELRRRT